MDLYDTDREIQQILSLEQKQRSKSNLFFFFLFKFWAQNQISFQS